MTVLVTAASEQGATYGIAEAIGRTIEAHGIDATLARPDEILDPEEFEAFVIGSAIYTGHWREPATRFVRRFAQTLSERPVWLFSSGPVGDPRRKLVQKMAADPAELPELLTLTNAREHRMFAGKLVGQELSGARQLSLVVFRGLQGDWRDWRAVESWAGEIAVALGKSDAGAHRKSRDETSREPC
jgi:menaquinone-dependent protoporphyrinogen oxidase